MTNHLALIQNERRHEYRRRLIAVEKSWRDAQVAILFGKASRKAAFATNDSGRYWRLSGAKQSGVVERRFGDHTGPIIEDERCWTPDRVCTRQGFYRLAREGAEKAAGTSAEMRQRASARARCGAAYF